MKNQDEKVNLESEATTLLLLIEHARSKSEAIANRLGRVFSTFYEAEAVHLELQKMFDEIIEEDNSIEKRLDDYFDILKTAEKNATFFVHHVMPLDERYNYMSGFMKGVATVIMGWYEMHGDIEKVNQITKKYEEMSKEKKDLSYIG